MFTLERFFVVVTVSLALLLALCITYSQGFISGFKAPHTKAINGTCYTAKC